MIRRVHVQTLWAGEVARDVKHVSFEELLSVATTGALGTKTQYRVH